MPSAKHPAGPPAIGHEGTVMLRGGQPIREFPRNHGEHATETPLPLTDGTGTVVHPGFPADLPFSRRRHPVAARLPLRPAPVLILASLAGRLPYPRRHTSAARSTAPVPA